MLYYSQFHNLVTNISLLFVSPPSKHTVPPPPCRSKRCRLTGVLAAPYQHVHDTENECLTGCSRLYSVLKFNFGINYNVFEYLHNVAPGLNIDISLFEFKQTFCDSIKFQENMFKNNFLKDICLSTQWCLHRVSRSLDRLEVALYANPPVFLHLTWPVHIAYLLVCQERTYNISRNWKRDRKERRENLTVWICGCVSNCSETNLFSKFCLKGKVLT